MDKKANKHNEKEKPNWDWTHIECYLKTVEANRKSTIWNLTPSIILTNPSSDNAGPNVRLYIDTEKSLQYSNELGWNWHKSWNIPNISLRLEIKDESTGDFLLSPRNLYAQIFAVKKNSENEKTDRMTLIDVGIRGESKMQMIDGQVYFSAIKFSSTTYNNEGINFNLLIVLYINQGEFEKPKVLTAVISPPIFVDSRRSARDYQEKKFSSFVEPFGYDNIEKEFIKRENKSKSESEVIIRNDPEGFYNYITAPNIRHKVKHPVFLAIKFSTCVKISYNSKLVQNTGINELLENLQTRLLKENKGKQKNESEVNANLEEKYFLFVVSNLTDSLKRKKVIESIETMQNEFIGIACGNDQILDSFVPIDNIETLKKGYKETYESLVNICQNYEPEYQEESEDEYYSDQYDESEKSSKKFKKEPSEKEPVRTSQRNKTSIISNNKQAERQERQDKKEKEKPEGEAVLKKEELFESQFQAPVFFNNNEPQQNVTKKNSVSAFSKTNIGFKNVNQNNPVFDTSQLNKAFSSNMANLEYNDLNQNNPMPQSFLNDFHNKASQIKTQEKNLVIGQNNSLGLGQHSLNSALGNSGLQGSNINQNLNQLNNAFNMQNLGMGGGYNSSIHDNLVYSNIMLNNWLTSVKNNNNSLYQNLHSHTLTDQILHKNNLERYLQTEQAQKMYEMNKIPLQNEEQQSIICLIQQINLYKELLAQVNYQNQLLTRDITYRQQNAMSMNQMRNSHNDMSQYGNLNYLGNMNSQLGGLGSQLGGLGSGLGSQLGGMNSQMGGLNMQNLPGMSGLGGLSSGVFGNGMLGNQMNLGGMMMNPNRPGDNLSKEKETQPQPNPLSGSGIKDNGLLSNLGGLGGLGGLSGLGGMGGVFGNNSFDFIKNIVLEEIKKEAEQKEREREKQEGK